VQPSVKEAAGSGLQLGDVMSGCQFGLFRHQSPCEIRTLGTVEPEAWALLQEEKESGLKH